MDRVKISRDYDATYTGRGEFYTGLTPGARVRVHEDVTLYDYDGKRRASVSLSASRLGDDGKPAGAWLSLYDRLDSLSDVTAADSTDGSRAAAFWARPRGGSNWSWTPRGGA